MKRILSLLLLSVLLLGCFSACGEGEISSSDSSSESDTAQSDTSSSQTASSDTDSSNTSTSTQKEEEKKELNRIPGPETNLVFATDQARRRVVVYDLDACTGDDLDKCIVWNHSPDETGVNLAGLKYREDTAFGDVIVIIGGQFASIVSYPGGNVLWKTNYAGNNGHCIEILPGGNVVTAASTGNTLTLFNTSARVSSKNAQVTRKVYELEDAHGVLWDPEYKVLWALGIKELAAYNVVGEGAEMELVRNEELSAKLPTQYGHALSADFTDKDYLWLSTGSMVYRFCKKDGTFSARYDNSVILNHSNVKGFGNNPLGNFAYTYPNGGPKRSWAKLSIAEWCTDTITYVYRNESGQTKLRNCVSKTAAFYKVVPFYGQYQ